MVLLDYTICVSLILIQGINFQSDSGQHCFQQIEDMKVCSIMKELVNEQSLFVVVSWSYHAKVIPGENHGSSYCRYYRVIAQYGFLCPRGCSLRSPTRTPSRCAERVSQISQSNVRQKGKNNLKLRIYLIFPNHANEELIHLKLTLMWWTVQL